MYSANDQYEEMVNFGDGNNSKNDSNNGYSGDSDGGDSDGGDSGEQHMLGRYIRPPTPRHANPRAPYEPYGEPCDGEYMNIDNIHDVENYYMFNKTVIKSDVEILKNLMNECICDRSKDLKITGENIDKIPNELCEFDWLETLTIERSNICVLDNLPPNIKTLNCYYNKIKILDGSIIPDSVNILTFTHNSTIKVVGLKDGIRELNLSSNKLIQINCKIPSTVLTLDVSFNGFLNVLPQFGDHLRVLNIASTSIHNIDDMNDGVQILDSCKCNFDKINKLPKDLIIWKSYTSDISEINCEFPLNLIELDLFNNCLKKVPILPNTIKSIDLARNGLTEIPIFPFTVESVDLKDNPGLDVKLLEEIETKLIDGKLLYDKPCATNFRYQNFWSGNNFGFVSSSENYSESNPHYIPLYKTYSVS